MLGYENHETSLFSYSVNLDKRVRADHPLRKINQALDLSFVPDMVAKFYGKRGNVSVPPRTIVKMLLLLFLDNIPSERELMRIIPERLDYLWFLGYSLDDDIPDHSVLSKARAKWGIELFESIFQISILQCAKAGLIDGTKLHIDSSLIKAHASKNSITEASPELIKALRQAVGEQVAKLDEPIVEGVNASHISKTDPDATVACKPGTPSQLSYKAHRVIDDKEGVVTAVVTTTGIASDSKQLPALVEQHEKNTAIKAQSITGDGHYGTAETYRFTQQHNIQSYLRAVESHSKKISVNDFVYEPQINEYRCPQGHHLAYHRYLKDVQLMEYLIKDAKVCEKCPLRSQCTESKQGRSIKVPIFKELVGLGKEQSQSQEARQALKRRQHLMERSFADATNNHGFKRARWRRLWRQRIQDLMIATVQNLRILIRGRNKRPKKAAPGTLAELNREILRLNEVVLLLSDRFLGVTKRFFLVWDFS